MNKIGKALLILSGVLAVLDFTHWIINEFYDPFEGIFDSTLHVLIQLSTVIYIPAALYLLHYIQLKLPTIDRKYGTILALALVAFCVFEWLYMKGPGEINERGVYLTQMYPNYVAGFFPTIVGYALSTFFKEHTRILVIFYFSLILWVAGPLIVDSMYVLVGGDRAAEIPIHNIPIIGSLYMNFTTVIGFGLFLALLSLPAVLGFSVYALVKSSSNYNRVIISALTVSSIFLIYNLVTWSGFILD